ncbi:MAG: hypothetical protein HYU83_06135, partial [Chloroflexi bacterium]|nr:hypothetical protein [Chloroflexota bacterium]
MSIFRYSEWDGSQNFDLDADELMDELGRNLMSNGDLSQILRMMQRGGIRDGQGRRMPGIQDLLQRLRQRKQEQLEKYKLDSVFDGIQQQLEKILQTEREGIQKRLDEARQKAEEGTGELSPEVQQRLLKKIEEMAKQNLEKLDGLPSDIGSQIKELTKYDFMDEEARRQFQELMDMLKKHAMESFGRDLIQKMQGMDPNALNSIRHMVE